MSAPRRSARGKVADHSERGPVIWQRERERRWKDCVHPFEAGEPVSYMSWHGWADEHMKTHVHTACPDCGLFVVCEPKAR